MKKKTEINLLSLAMKSELDGGFLIALFLEVYLDFMRIMFLEKEIDSIRISILTHI